MTSPDHTTPALWHYTCEHGDAGISREARGPGAGLVRPGGDGFVWAADLDVPVRDALGLTSHLLDCDRMAHRWRIDDLSVAAYFLPWVEARWSVDPVRRDAIEGAPGALLRHWWVARVPVWAVRA